MMFAGSVISRSGFSIRLNLLTLALLASSVTCRLAVSRYALAAVRACSAIGITNGSVIPADGALNRDFTPLVALPA